MASAIASHLKSFQPGPGFGFGSGSTQGSAPKQQPSCIVGGVGMSASLAHEVALQLGLHGGVEVRVLALAEAARVRLAWDMCRQPWFQCHHLVRAGGPGPRDDEFVI